MGKSGDSIKYGPWNPGLESHIPRDVLRLSTMFREDTVETGFDEAHELADFSGLKPIEIATFRPERLIVHELMIRVTSDLSVPDGPGYEELGINLRTIIARIYDQHISGHLDNLIVGHEELRRKANARIGKLLSQMRRQSNSPNKQQQEPNGLVQRVFSLFSSRDGVKPESDRISFEPAAAEPNSIDDLEFEQSCRDALDCVTQSVIGHRGGLIGDQDTLVNLATGRVLNSLGSRRLGAAIEPIIRRATRAEGYRSLPAQTKPLILNVKGASAAGKSTMRPHQRELAKKLGVQWEDFALISPDYWRKYLLNYELLGAPFKYGAMLTGHELEIIDKKLDRYMAQKAEAGTMPHLLVDRFRFDSFQVGDDKSSQLLTRFGEMAYLFFMITSPEETVERAWKRGLSTGRYKAVDDLLDHNIEAYTGMSELFFSWALSEKKVHFEFLDNNVAKDERPKTIAAGWSSRMTVFDISGLLNIERYKKVNIHASKPDEVYQDESQVDDNNLGFLQQCCERLERVTFVDPVSRKPHAIVENQSWTWRDRLSSQSANKTAALLKMAGFIPPDKSGGRPPKETSEPLSDVTVGYLVGVIEKNRQ